MDWGEPEDRSTFVWNKKLEKQGLKSLSRKELEVRNRRKQKENLEELEKIKKRRLERENQRQQREDDMYLLQRSKEAAQFEEWQRQEETFHLDQARLRSKIRIQDGRAKPIDLLAQYINDQSNEDSIEMQMHEPYSYLNGLNMDDFEDLLVDIKIYNDLENRCNIEYWDDLTIIVEDEIQKLRKIETEKNEYRAAGREGIHQSVAKDVTDVFKGKTTTQLDELKLKIECKINTHADGVDVGYWESLLSQLKAHMARARLRDKHQDNLRAKLAMLKREQEETALMQREIDEANSALSDPQPSTSRSTSAPENPEEIKIEEDDESDVEDEEEASSNKISNFETEMLEECFDLYEEGNFSPRYLCPEDLEPGTEMITEEDDDMKIEHLRIQVFSKNTEQDKADITMRKEAKRGMGADEAEFSVETKINSETYLWSDKYRPRKPRYFNRVHTGFEWNKYNQTHYDMDNPPPKIVQGYKFNIFYPDMIDKSSTPKYFLTPDPENPDFATLRFHSGPPYEDIGFKIVNREWEFSYKRGFRCQFHNNIFQLWFHFKRYRYRR